MTSRLSALDHEDDACLIAFIRGQMARHPRHAATRADRVITVSD